MFPISSTSLSGPNAANFQLVTPTPGAAAVASVNASTIDAVGSALDAPAPASVTIDLSPVANFLMTVSQSQQQITQLQASVANGDDPQEAAARAATLNDATQNVVNAFNLLPSVELDQSPLQGPSLLNSLVEGLNRQTTSQQAAQEAAPQSAAQSLAQNLAQIGVTLQPPLLSDAAGGLSLDNEILRASFNTDNRSTTNTLQNTLDTFSELATRFAEQLSATGSSALPALAGAQQPAMTPADLAANARLDMARAELDLLSQIPYQETAADRLVSQRAALEQPLTPENTAPDSPIINPLQASTAEVIAAQNAQAREDIDALPSQQSQQAQTAQALQAADQAFDLATDRAAQQANLRATEQANDQAATQATDRAQAAAQANAVRNAAATAEANDRAEATAERQAVTQQTAMANLAAADAAAASAQAQAQAAQSAADALAAQSDAAVAAAAQARAALNTPTTQEAADASAALAAQQAGAAQTTAGNQANTNAAADAADAAQQARAAQVAAVQTATAQTNPLQGNPALAAAIAAYNITDPAVLGANARAAQSTVTAIPRVGAVEATTRTRGVGQ
jgi:hypothetical protein